VFGFVRVPDKSTIPVSNVNDAFAVASLTNSTETALSANGFYVGGADDLLNYSAVTILIHADVASASNGLIIQFSGDASDWHNGEVYTIPSNSTKFFTPPVQARYMRLLYTNGTDNQSDFHIHTVLKKYPVKWSSHNIDDPIKDQDDAELVKAVLTGKANGDGYKNVRTTVDGDLKISDNSSGLSIAQGNVTGASFVHKFGNIPDMDTGDGGNKGPVVFDGADDGNINAMDYTYSTAADIDTLSSSSASDTFSIELQGLDGGYNLIIQTNTLNGTNKVTLATPLLRLFRMVNQNSTDNVGHVYCFTNGATTGGVPTDATMVRAIIQPTNNQTLMSIYTVKTNAVGYLRDFFAATAGANRDANYRVDLYVRPPGGVFQLKHRTAIQDGGTSFFRYSYTEPEIIPERSDIEMRVKVLTGAITAASVSTGFDLVIVDN
jgi:hypothetical protein